MTLVIVDRTEFRPARVIRSAVRVVDRLIGSRYKQDPTTYGQDDVVLTSPDGIRVNYHCSFSGDSCHLKISLDGEGDQLEKEKKFLTQKLEGILS